MRDLRLLVLTRQHFWCCLLRLLIQHSGLLHLVCYRFRILGVVDRPLEHTALVEHLLGGLESDEAVFGRFVILKVKCLIGAI